MLLFKAPLKNICYTALLLGIHKCISYIFLEYISLQLARFNRTRNYKTENIIYLAVCKLCSKTKVSTLARQVNSNVNKYFAGGIYKPSCKHEPVGE